MHFDSLKKRMIRIATTPPELLFAMTRHWLIVAGCLAVGTTVMLGKVATDTQLYSGTLTLLVDPGATAEYEGGTGRIAPGAGQRFLQAQVEIFKSDSVLRRIVQLLTHDQVLIQDENPEEKNYGPIRTAVNDLRTQILDGLNYLKYPGTNDFGIERDIQRAIRALRRRSVVTANPRTGLLELKLYGNNRQRLHKELTSWELAYRKRTEDLQENVFDNFVRARQEQYRIVEEKAQAEIDEFQAVYPEVSANALERLQAEKAGLEGKRLEARGHLVNLKYGRAPSTALNTADESPEVKALRDVLSNLRIQRSTRLATFRETSPEVQAVEREIKQIKAALIRAEGGIDLNEDPLQSKLRLETEIEDHTQRLREIYKAERILTTQLETLGNLKRRLTEYSTRRERVETDDILFRDLLARDKVTVQQVNPPSVNTQPALTFPHRQVLYGTAAGASLGILIALLMETLSNKIRFRSDIENDLDLPVVGVIPRK